MPEFVCRTCGELISYGIDNSDLIPRLEKKDYDTIYPYVLLNTSIYDQWLFNQLRGNCTQCYSVIAQQNYPRNISDGRKKYTTVFSSMGQSLGDRIMQQVIKDEYERCNPDERVIWLMETGVDFDVIREYRPVKVFWANLFTGGQEWVPRDAYWFAVTNEAHFFAEQGKYARLPFEKEKLKKSVQHKHERFVIFHLRNILNDPKKDKAKNIQPHYVYSIFKLLQNRYKAGVVDAVYLVGNDSLENGYDVETITRIIDDSLPIVDYRNNLSLGEIAWLGERAILGIGIDSGMMHVLGAAGCMNLVSWGYATERWFPKVCPERLDAWVKRDSSVDKVLDAVHRRLNKG